ncbi:AGAP012570-PA [Anopheles gambiae str. PEST]|uniref:AGAP012570-PA n=1 Tax=Anopheles gambiae TaxID=7165 RepID=Q5TY72_ANOGA|nr:AGAP012570-PA [Anopheles gambiae str. PEST]
MAFNRISPNAPFTTSGTSPARDGSSHPTFPEPIQETSSVTIYFTVGPTISSTCASRTSTSKEYDPATRTQPAITWSFLILSRAIASTRCTVVAGAS